ncbi:hypothetical protein CCAX7_62620 [Capsulimonas corticalis]|uniref:Uncharacterized protein n=1 Tax=Capsulimonas corticalis TaxID=2219043 RepID=A0A402CWM4_9BACT|nr:SRPBCC family protein [Capsulimonas corticalis]BDI34211.1 hypothetical protein CCAX7_62620 [Capsulimonas corticalis]
MSSAHASIPWPPERTPEKSPIHQFHDIRIAAPASVVWPWLVGVLLWPRYNPMISDIAPLDASAMQLALGVSFQWRRGGYTLLSTVTDYMPGARLGWKNDGLWLRGFQEWLLIPDGDGCVVRVEETLSGFVPWLFRRSISRALGRIQNEWLESLRQVSEEEAPRSAI